MPQSQRATGLGFDAQAAEFDARAGLPVAVARAVADSVAKLLGGGPLLDLGAGTGEIGADLARRVAAAGGTYLGVDRSAAMLAVFAAKLGDRPSGVALARADADRPWPIRDHSVATIFSSRAVHLLRFDHLIHDIERVTVPGARLVLGRVRRAEDSLRDALRRQMRRLLAAEGVPGRGGRAFVERFAEALVARGAEREPSRDVASWAVVERPADSLAAWRAKDGLAGRALPTDLRDAVLDRLDAWARERYGDLFARRPSTDRYVLDIVRLPGETA